MASYLTATLPILPAVIISGLLLSGAYTEALPFPQDSPMTTANAFSTFLVLILGHLTQPYGRLYLRAMPDCQPGWLWKLSPISCIHEMMELWQDLIELTIPRGGRSIVVASNAILHFRRIRERDLFHPNRLNNNDLFYSQRGFKYEIFVSVEMLFVLLKVCVIRGAPWTRVLIMAYLMPWIMVQVMVISAESRPLEEQELDAVESIINSRIKQMHRGGVVYPGNEYVFLEHCFLFVLSIDTITKKSVLLVFLFSMFAFKIAGLLSYFFRKHPERFHHVVDLIYLGLFIGYSSLFFRGFDEKGTYRPQWMDWIGM
jgi:hypothetical protein